MRQAQAESWSGTTWVAYRRGVARIAVPALRSTQIRCSPRRQATAEGDCQGCHGESRRSDRDRVIGDDRDSAGQLGQTGRSG
jgi:hypothetical protein